MYSSSPTTILYINDVSDIFHDNVSIKLFADDIKIYMEIENISQTVIFQEYINVVSDWADKWQLKLSLGLLRSSDFSNRLIVSKRSD